MFCCFLNYWGGREPRRGQDAPTNYHGRHPISKQTERKITMWSTVGSAGTVDVGDIGKVNFAGSVVQIGFDSKNISFGNLVEHFVAVGTPGAVGSPGAVERFV